MAGRPGQPGRPARSRLNPARRIGHGGAGDATVPELSLSIVIPTHNRPVLLRRAVLSALAAAPEGAEILVADDASDPPAAEALGDLAATHPALRVIRNGGTRGAAGARNFGVSLAAAPLILFLDDDDEVMPDYPARVLRAATGPEAPGFGFSAVVIRTADGPDAVESRSLPTGPVPLSAPLRHRIAALSAGFWIRRELFQSLGGFAPDQVVDEDTGLCCALAVRGIAPWYEGEPGVTVHRGHSAAGSAAQLTRSTRSEVVAACYLRTWARFGPLFPRWSEARWFLATRYIRRAVKGGQVAESWHMVRAARPLAFSAGLALFWGAKSAVQRVRSASQR